MDLLGKTREESKSMTCLKGKVAKEFEAKIKEQPSPQHKRLLKEASEIYKTVKQG